MNITELIEYLKNNKPLTAENLSFLVNEVDDKSLLEDVPIYTILSDDIINRFYSYFNLKDILKGYIIRDENDNNRIKEFVLKHYKEEEILSTAIRYINFSEEEIDNILSKTTTLSRLWFHNIIVMINLSSDFIKKYINYLDPLDLAIYQKLDEDTIEWIYNYMKDNGDFYSKNRSFWSRLSTYQTLSESFILKWKYHIN